MFSTNDGTLGLNMREKVLREVVYDSMPEFNWLEGCIRSRFSTPLNICIKL